MEKFGLQYPEMLNGKSFGFTRMLIRHIMAVLCAKCSDPNSRKGGLAGNQLFLGQPGTDVKQSPALLLLQHWRVCCIHFHPYAQNLIHVLIPILYMTQE
jgi:hypothetical protein